MSKISIYEVAPVPKLADKLIGTSVGGEIEDITYNFTLGELLNLFIPNIPANNLQGVLNFGNTATQNINLTGTISTTNINVSGTASILNSNLTGETRVTGGLFDRTNSKGTAGQVLISTGTQVEWFTIPTIIPTLQQVLSSGNTADINIILTSNIQAVTVTGSSVVSNTNLSVLGTLRDKDASVGAAGQILSSTGTKVQWVNAPIYTATSPLSIDSGTRVISIQQAGSSQDGYLSSLDWISFNGKQNGISLTTIGSSGPSTFIASVLNVPNYTLVGLGGVPLSRTLSINGVTYDLSADRSWTVDTLPAQLGNSGKYLTTDGTFASWGVINLSGYVPTSRTISTTGPLVGGGDLSADRVISIPAATGSVNGYLSFGDWNTFNNKQDALGFTPVPTTRTITINGVTQDLSANRTYSIDALPSQTGNAGKYLTTNGTDASWGAISTANIYNSDGTLTGNRVVTMGAFSLSFEKDISINGITIGRGLGNISTNFAIGNSALAANTTGNNNFAIGFGALFQSTTGANNIAIGSLALRNATNPTDSIAIGSNALLSSSGAGNIGIGTSVLSAAATGNINIGIGTLALNVCTSGSNNLALGSQSLIGNTTGAFNIAVGNYALGSNIGSSNSTAVGWASMYVSTGANNTALGFNSGRYAGAATTSNVTSNNSLYLGYQTRASANGNTNEIVIGYDALGIGSNTTMIGNSSTITTAIRGRLLLGTTTDSGLYQLDVNGTARVSGGLTINSGSTLNWNNVLTAQNRILFYDDGNAGARTGIGQNAAADLVNFCYGGKNIFFAMGYDATNVTTSNANAYFDGGRRLNLNYNLLIPTGTKILMNAGQYGAIYSAASIGMVIEPFDLAAVRPFIVYQNTGGSVGIGDNSAGAINSAQLFLNSTTKGFLQPRMTTTQRDAIASPATGLQVYNTTTNTNDTYNGTTWISEGNVSGSGVAGQVTYWNGIGSVTGSNNLFWDNTNSRLGIGTASPSFNFDLVGSARMSGALVIDGFTNPTTSYLSLRDGFVPTAAGGSGITAKNNQGLNADGLGIWGADGISFNTAQVERMLISQTGVISFPNSTTLAATTMASALVNGILSLDAFNNPTTSYIALRNGFAPSGSGGIGFTAKNHQDLNADGLGVWGMDGISFQTAITERARITSAGRLLLGTTSESTFLLDVNGTARVSGEANIQGLTAGTGNNSPLGNLNTAFGYQAGFSNTSTPGGYVNSFFGYQAGRLVSTGYGNSFFGYNAGVTITTGVYNTAIGTNSMYSAPSTVNNNVAVGYATLGQATGSDNTCIGGDSGRVAGSSNVYIGYQSGYTTATGSNNIAIGRVSGQYTGDNKLYIAGSPNAYGNLIYGDFSTGQLKINNTNTLSLTASAQFEVVSTTRGFLGPRMTSTQRDAIATPAAGLQVYNTTGNTLDFYNGTSWSTVSSGNIYTVNGTLTSNRTLTTGGFDLIFTGTDTASAGLARFIQMTPTLVAAANGDTLVGLDISPTFTTGAFTNVNKYSVRINGGGNSSIYVNTGHILDLVYAKKAFTFAMNDGTKMLELVSGSAYYSPARLLVNNPTDDTFTPLQINGDVKSSANIIGNNFNSSYWLTPVGQARGGTSSGTIGGGYGQTSLGTFNKTSQMSIALGFGSSTTSANTFVAGSGHDNGGGFGNPWISDVYFGSGIQGGSGTTGSTVGYVTMGGVSYTINGSGGYGTDQIGGNITIAGGKGTGTGTSGDVIFATATPTSTGTTLQTLTNRVWIKGQTGNVGIGASPDAAYKLDVQGTARIKGTGTTSATTALLVQNSTGLNSLKVRDDGKVAFGAASIDCTIFGTQGSASKFEFYAFNGYDITDGFGNTLITGSGSTIRLPREVGVGFNAQNNSSAVLQADSTTKGFLPPRLTTTQKNAIATPAAGLIVYDSTTNVPNYYNGTAWLDYGLNIYNSNGTLTGNRTISTATGFKLTLNPNLEVITTTYNVIPTMLGWSAVNGYVQTTIPASTSFSSIGYAFSALIGNNYMTYQGSATFAANTFTGAIVGINNIGFTAASSTITITQSSSIRTYSAGLFQNTISGSVNGTITHMSGLAVRPIFQASGTSVITVTNNYGLLIADQNEFSHATITNRWGIYQEGISDNNYFSSKLLVGTTTDIASAKVIIDSTSQGVLVPRMTTTQINAITSPAEGLQVYNTTISHMCFYMNGAWAKINHSPM